MKALVFVRDGVGLLGAASISYGAWLIYEPSGFIVAGALILVGVLALSRGGG